MINSPLFCLTSDMDWASDFAIRDFVSLVGGYGITPTIFATNETSALAELAASGAVEVGIHPNFLPGSSHGSDVATVVDHLTAAFPHAQAFRSHAFADGSHITLEMVRRGYRLDSNVCLYLQPNLVPLRHSSGLVRFPVFWEDDNHWLHTDGDWSIDRYFDDFVTPGLKVLNFHPFLVAANVPTDEYYRRIKPYIPTLSRDNVAAVRHAGEGVRTFLVGLLDRLTARGERFYTLSELARMLPIEQFLSRRPDADGRTTQHSDAEHRRYWQLGDAERQAFVHESAERRNATDIYATSRDFHLRELEIDSIKQHLGQTGRLLDLGCGNGYTLLSIAKDCSRLDLVGVDFSRNLIDGALALSGARAAELPRLPSFVCDDAVRYVATVPAGSLDYVLTERFLLNLPSADAQRAMIRSIYRALAPGGRFLMCEGSVAGFDALNGLRAATGLPVVPATSADNVSAIRFADAEIEAFAEREVGFRLAHKAGYSAYFVMTRVLHPLLVAPQPPRFDAKINELAAMIQRHMPHAPDYGANVLWVFDKPLAQETGS